MRKVNAARTFHSGLDGDAGELGAMERIALRNQKPLSSRVFGGPSLAAVETAGEEVFLGPFAVDSMALGAEVFVVTPAESYEYLIVPHPDAMVGGPASEACGFVIDHDVFQDGHRLLVVFLT
jgi:hypothetical protein